MNDPTWTGTDQTPEIEPPGPIGWLRVIGRGIPLAILVFGGLIILLLARLLERPIYGQYRPVTPHITVFVCRTALRIMGMGYKMHGRPMQVNGVMVANHSSWLDIFTLNAGGQLYFVSKAEVAGWPGIGWLARATGTVFIERDRRQARAHVGQLEDRILNGHRLLFFPEGTSTDGQRVLQFKSTLFGTFFTERIRDDIAVQPVSVVYHAPDGSDPRQYGWWGDMGFAPHLLHTLSVARQGRVEVMYHEPIPVTSVSDRKALATRCEARVRDGHETLRNK